MNELAKPRLAGWLDGLGGNEQRETRWLTPPHVVQALGHFDLDPCGAPGHVLAERTYLPESGEDGLALPWEGRVFCNPPYGKEAWPFMRRMVEHGRGTLLVFASVETEIWFETVWPKATAILFPKGRLTFLRGDGSKPVANSGKPSALIAYGERDALALESSGITGQVVRLQTPVLPTLPLRPGYNGPTCVGCNGKGTARFTPASGIPYMATCPACAGTGREPS